MSIATLARSPPVPTTSSVRAVSNTGETMPFHTVIAIVSTHRYKINNHAIGAHAIATPLSKRTCATSRTLSCICAMLLQLIVADLQYHHIKYGIIFMLLAGIGFADCLHDLKDGEMYLL
jgi:hypothetical protein